MGLIQGVRSIQVPVQSNVHFVAVCVCLREVLFTVIVGAKFCHLDHYPLNKLKGRLLNTGLTV